MASEKKRFMKVPGKKNRAHLYDSRRARRPSIANAPDAGRAVENPQGARARNRRKTSGPPGGQKSWPGIFRLHSARRAAAGSARAAIRAGTSDASRPSRAEPVTGPPTMRKP